ncbi:MAG: hypothetical protein LBD47_09655 [Treponema sp.]|nr:hypothetical protein [Treponema sp.]
MGREILKAQLRDFNQIGQRADREIQPRRRDKYDYADAVKSAYGVFFFQHPSMLNFQQDCERNAAKRWLTNNGQRYGYV